MSLECWIVLIAWVVFNLECWLAVLIAWVVFVLVIAWAICKNSGRLSRNEERRE